MAVSILILWPSGNSLAQDEIGTPLLRIAGPARQHVHVVIRYFDNGKASPALVTQQVLGSEPLELELEFGHAGGQVLIYSPTRRPVKAVLANAQRVLQSVESRQPQTLELQYGVIPENDAFERPQFALNSSDRQLVLTFLERLDRGKTQDLVSESSLANVDSPTLAAFFAAVHQRYGERLDKLRPRAEQQLDGWSSWDGSLGARVTSGPVTFAQGSMRLTPMFIDGQLVDVTFEADSRMQQWFEGPTDETRYQREAERAIRALMTQDINTTYNLFARRFRDGIRQEELEDFSFSLLEYYGDGIHAIEAKPSVFSTPSEQGARLSIIQAVEMANGKRAIAQVDFEFACGPDRIGRGDLATINVREAWQSAAPELARQARQLVHRMTNSEPWSLDAFHPAVGRLIDEERLRREWQPASALVGVEAKVDFDQWRASRQGERFTAEGPLQGPGGEVQVQIDFLQDQVLGLSYESEFAGASTLGLLAAPGEIEQRATQFWTDLLSGKLESAYQQMAADFQTQMAFDEFQQAMKVGGQASRLHTLELDQIRLSNELGRNQDVMLAVYLMGVLEDGTRQPLRCEFRRAPTESTDPTADAGQVDMSEWELLNFHSDFEARFCVANGARLNKLVAAFNAGDAAAIIDLLGVGGTRVQPAVLTGFLKQLGAAGKLSVGPSVKTVHSYRVGRRQEMLSTLLSSEEGDPIPLEAEYQYGELRSFVLRSDRLQAFVEQIEGDQCYRDRTAQFVSAWLEDDAESAVLPYLVAPLQTAEVERKLTQLRTLMGNAHGKFLQWEPSAYEVQPATNRVRCTVELAFEDGSQEVDLEFEVDAFSALVTAVEPRDP